MVTNFVHRMLVGVSFALLFQVHRVSTIECGKGTFIRAARSITHVGTATIKGEWPFIATIYKDAKDICGGTIISYRHILTAAHCIQSKFSEYELLPHEVVVRLGGYNLTNSNEMGMIQRNVSEIFMHDDWNPFEKKYDADIAILVLSENITFTDNIRPVCLPASGITESMEGVVVGYAIQRNGIIAEIPRRITVRAVNICDCILEDNGFAAYLSRRTFCGVNVDGSLALGDAGNGIFFTNGISWAQYGIVSLARTNATGHMLPNAYNGYTNLTMFKDWIIETVNRTGGVVGEASINQYSRQSI